MKVFKFGGASVRDTSGVKNLVSVLKEVGFENTLVVVSAMGKTTNALEKIIDNYFNESINHLDGLIELKQHHIEIAKNLFKNESSKIEEIIHNLFEELNGFLKSNKSLDYSFVYDQVVSIGEILSSKIVHAFMNFSGLGCHWIDSRECIKTDDYYRAANLNWELTNKNILNNLKTCSLAVTQGFIGSNSNNFTTTLGREGSDYSAAIFAHALDASSLTIWKDVPGVLNGDPRVFKETKLLKQISYREAIELAFYGASVIHPKTLQPLQRKEIPLYVKSFENPKNVGTVVSKGKNLDPFMPCYIVKKNKVLLRLSTINFSFIVEENISYIFRLLHEYQMPVELMQNSAISFSVCISNKYRKLEELLLILRARFNVEVNQGVDLFTIRHYNQEASNFIKSIGKPILLEQRTEQTAQFVI